MGRIWNRIGYGLRGYGDRRVLLLLPLGFGSGVPLLLVLSTLTVWLTEAGLTKAGIGLFAWVGIAWAFKYLWAPLVDALPIPWLGRVLGQRRSWMLVGQLAIAGALWALSFQNPLESVGMVALWAVIVAFASSTYDIALDAWRVESLDDDLQGNGSSLVQLGYRIAMLLTGAGALWLASWLRQDSEVGTQVARSVVRSAAQAAERVAGSSASTAVSVPNLHMVEVVWPTVYRVMGSLMLVAVVATLFASEPGARRVRAAAGELLLWSRHPELRVSRLMLRLPGPLQRAADAVVAPFVAFFTARSSLGGAALVLLFVLLFKLSDSVAGNLMNPFLVEIGFAYGQIAAIQKVFGTVATIVGTFAGGTLYRAFGVKRALWIAGILQVASNLMFVYQARAGADPVALHLTIGVENLSGGLGAGAFVAYLSSLCSLRYSATQYALLSSLAMVGRTLVAGSVGFVADRWGWEVYFIFSTVIGIPGLVALWLLGRSELASVAPLPDATIGPEGPTGPTAQPAPAVQSEPTAQPGAPRAATNGRTSDPVESSGK